MVFDPREREALRARLLRRAEDDPRISAAALIGSAASGREDRWSDIDLMVAVAAGHEVDDVLAAWTRSMYLDARAVHHFDLHAGGAVYRAFLLPDALEADLSFAAQRDFHRRGDGAWRTVLGQEAPQPTDAPPGDPPDRVVDHLVGLCWHHVLNAATCLRRGRPWQAEHWISALRDHTLTLACSRLALPTVHAAGADRLPDDVTGPLGRALVRSLEHPELTRALAAATSAFLDELGRSDLATADALRGPLEAALRG